MCLLSLCVQVALVAADFFSGTYLPSLKAVPSSSPFHHSVMAQHTPLLQCLTESLVLRTQLKPEVAAVATADARDLPEQARTVRHLLVDMFSFCWEGEEEGGDGVC